MWWNIMVSGLILLVFRWHILERTETWTRSKENCSSDATSVYMCEWNKEFWENTITREFILEWVINGATASLSLLNTSGSVAMHRYQWLSNICMPLCAYIHCFSHLECVDQQEQQEWQDNLHNSQWSLLSQHANQWYLLRLNGNRPHSCFWM